MKKRFIASPLLVIVAAVTWNVALRQSTPVATAETLAPYLSPATNDSRHPVDVFNVAMQPGQTEESVLADLPTTIYPEDKVTFVVDPSWGLGTIVQVKRALPVTVVDGNQTIIVRTWDNSVGDLLDAMNRPLGELDKANYSTSDILMKNMTISITRVAKTPLTITQSVAYSSTQVKDNTMWQGDSTVTQTGANGVRTIVYMVTRENGVEVSRVVTSNTITTQPTNEIVHVGTKPRITVPCGGWDATVLDAAIKNGIDPNSLCYRLMKESNGHADSQSSLGYQGLFQYTANFWATMSAASGYSGTSIWDGKSQIYVTAWAWANGYRGHWPNP